MELRKYPRFPVQLPISFTAEEVEGEGTIYNLSTGGCAVESNTHVPEDSYLQLRIHIPDHRSPIAIELAAVRWALRREFGVEFISLRGEDRERLLRYLIALGGASH